MCKFMIVEDSKNLREAIAWSLESIADTVVDAGTVSDATRMLDINGIDCMVLDVNLPDGTANDIFAHMKKNNMFVPTIVVSGGAFTPPDGAENNGFISFISKPFKNSDMREMVERASNTSGAAHRFVEQSKVLRDQTQEIQKSMDALRDLGFEV